MIVLTELMVYFSLASDINPDINHEKVAPRELPLQVTRYVT